MMPKKTIEPTAEELAALGPGTLPPSLSGRLIDFWTAVSLLVEEDTFSTPASDFDKQWLKSIFGERDEMLDTEIRERLETRESSRTRRTAC